jgi:hypothetical protein
MKPEHDRDEPGEKVDDRTRRTLGKLLRDSYRDQVESELPQELAELLGRLQSRLG